MSERTFAEPKKGTMPPVAGRKPVSLGHGRQPPATTGNVSLADMGYEFSRVAVTADSRSSPGFKQSCPLSLDAPRACPFGGACHSCPAAVQAKLTISQPGDKYEQEADRVADRVMSMPEPVGEEKQPKCGDCGDDKAQRLPEDEEEVDAKLLQREPDDEEKEDEVSGKLIQRQDEPPSPEEDEEEPEREASRMVLQRQDAPPKPEEEDEEPPLANTKTRPGHQPVVSPGVAADIQTIRSGGGQALSPATRAYMEPRFGRDFSRVRVHADAKAADTAQAVRAKAFTVGRDIVFGGGQYAPDTQGGRRLLAHELAHTIQQNYRRSRVQRKIIVAGKPYTPRARYYTWLDNNNLSPMKEFIKRMHNAGNPPEYKFSSYDQLGREVRGRNEALQGMMEVNTNGSVNYGSPKTLDTNYWDKGGPPFHFKVKSPLPSGKKPSDAIESIFRPGANNILECNSLMVAVQYRAMLKALGNDKFNAKFPNGQGIIISQHTDPPQGTGPHPIWAKKLYKQLTISGEGDLLPGDWVYFKNYYDYTTWNSGGVWTGEHALYMGNGKYQGFGPLTFTGGTSMTKVALEKELCDNYNIGADLAHKKTYVPSMNVYPFDNPTLGLRNYARRPVIKEIDK